MHGDHPTTEELLQFVDRSLAPSDRAGVEEHLSKCPSCARAAEEMERVVTGVRKLPLERTSPGFTASVLHEVGLVTSGRRQSRVLEIAAAMAAMMLVAGLLLTAFFAGGLLSQNEGSDTHTAVERILNTGGDAIARGMNGVGTAMAPYLSFLFGKDALGISVMALAVLVLLAVVDWFAGRRLMHRTTK